MTMERRSRSGSRAAEALKLAASHGETDLAPLLDAVPAMLAEARRRRAAASMPAARLSAAGRVWLPRLAAATAVLLLVALFWPATSPRQRVAATTTDETAALDQWIVTGSDAAGVTDPVLAALVR